MTERRPSKIAAAAVLALLLVPSLVLADGGDGTLKAHIEYLASDALEGRLTGSPGEKAAADYLIQQLEQLGAKPLPGQASMRVPFEFTSGSKDLGSSLTLGDTKIEGEANVRALSFSDNGETEGGVVFAGYGIVVPDSQDFGYDSYATLDVTDKIVIILRYFPEDASQEVRAQLSRYAGLRYKALMARERGAKAILVVQGPNSPNAGETIPLTFDTAVAGSGLAAASISGKTAEALLKAAGVEESLEALQSGLDTANPHVAGFELEGVQAKLDVRIEREKRTGYNVAAEIPTDAAGSSQNWLLLGAHYDHLGHGRGGNSLARDEDRGGIHNGADDNASGVAATLEIAERLQKKPPKSNTRVAVAFWSGEELGLLGATAFVKDNVLPRQSLAAYINFDMVGRVRDNKLSVQATGSSPAWPGLIERSNVPVGFDLSLQADPYLPTDSSAFNQAEVATLNFFSGSHGDYHRPSDDPEHINYEDLERVTQLGYLVSRKVLEQDGRLQFAKVERKMEEGGGRDSVRAYTGTIPDYATEVEGLLLSGVMEGGPAAEAGLASGDVIVEFAGQTITNIYDYTYALDAVKVDVPIKVVFMRGDEKKETTLTPRSRK